MSFDEIVDERAREEETLIAAGLKQEPLPPGEPGSPTGAADPNAPADPAEHRRGEP
jgi:hypothetical protein